MERTREIPMQDQDQGCQALVTCFDAYTLDVHLKPRRLIQVVTWPSGLTQTTVTMSQAKPRCVLSAKVWLTIIFLVAVEIGELPAG